METVLIKALQLFCCLSLLVVLHEGGHFGFAKLFKTRVTRFYMFANYGFHLFSTYDDWFRRLLGKPLVTKRGNEGQNFFAWLRNKYFLLTGQKDKVVTENIGNKEYDDNVGTEYGIGWLPIGGYVAIDGMIDETNHKLSSEPKPWEFRSKKIWQRFFIMFGGVLMNLITAWVIYSVVLFAWGRDYVPMTSIEKGFEYNEQARDIGFQNGDIPIRADGKEIAEYNGGAIMRTIANATTVTVLRGTEEIELRMPEEGLSMLKMIQSQPMFLAPLAEAIIDSVMPGSAADKAGIEKGMRLVAVNGKDISTWGDFDFEVTLRRQDVLGSPDCTAADSLRWRTLEAVVASPDRSRTDTISLLLDENYLMGVTRHVPDFKTVHLDYSLATCIPAGLSYGWRVLKNYVSDLRYVASADGAKSVGSFITIGNIFPDAWNWQQFWLLTALISIILAVMNILPIPGLDGGHIMLLLYEGITGHQPSEKAMLWIERIGLGILMALMLLAISNDFRNFILPLFGL